MDHCRSKVVPERVVLVGLQAALDRIARNTVAHKKAACKTADLDTMVLDKTVLDKTALDPKRALGHHHNEWYPKQRLMGLSPQSQAEMVRIQYTNDVLRGHNNDFDLARPDFGRHANTHYMPPLLEWNQKKVGH